MSKFKVGDKVRALAKCTDPYYSNEGYFKVGEEFTIKEVFPSQNTVSLVERSQSWDESRFELVEEPVNPNITNFKVGDKVRRKSDSYCYGWRRTDTVCTITNIYVRGNGVQSLTFDGASDCGWDGFRFELVEEAKPVAPAVPQLPGIPEGFRAVRIGTPKKGEWYVNVEGRAEQGDGYHSASCYVLLEKIDQPAPVEPAKPEAPAAPARKVAPVFKVGDKVRLVDNTNYERFVVGTVDVVVRKSEDIPVNGDLLIFEGPLSGSGGMYSYRFELVEEAKPVQPKFKKGDKVRYVKTNRWSPNVGFTVGKVYEVSSCDLRHVYPVSDDNGSWYRFRNPEEFELVTESPDDLVIQDRVPAREGVDFGWWVAPEKFDSFVPTEGTKWKMNSYYAGKMHGFATDIGRSLLFVMCYRKDLPELPTTEKVLLTEYVVWDDGGAKCIIWSTEDPSIENDVLEHWHRAYPTGNTREVEVPIVKP